MRNALLEESRPLAGEIVGDGGNMIVNVLAEVERALVEVPGLASISRFRCTRSCSSVVTTPRRSHSSSSARGRVSLLSERTSDSNECSPPLLASRGNGSGAPRSSR